MAAPSTVTTRDLSGKWIMNNKLSDDADPILQLQKVNWLHRAAIAMAPITLHLKHYTDQKTQLEHIDIEQIMKGVESKTKENRTLNSDWRDHSDKIFGTLRSRTQRVLFRDLEAVAKGTPADASAASKSSSSSTLKLPVPMDTAAFLIADDWNADTIENGLVLDNAVSDTNGWEVFMIWGLTDTSGPDRNERRKVRRLVVSNGEKKLKIRLLYDYIP